MTNVVLSYGPDINSKNADGNSALLLAIEVILKGQDFEEKKKFGWEGFHDPP